jgi:hypothetical protein
MKSESTWLQAMVACLFCVGMAGIVAALAHSFGQ